MHQDYILQILQTRKIPHEEIDISDPSCEGDKKFMRERSPPKEGTSAILPPQIFVDDEYCCVSVNSDLKVNFGVSLIASTFVIYLMDTNRTSFNIVWAMLHS